MRNGTLIATILVVFAPFSVASAISIDTTSTTAAASFHPFGEILSTDPSFSNDFANYFGQSFTALPGLAETLTVFLAPTASASRPDGTDFRALLAEVQGTGASSHPTNIIFESSLLTVGANLGTSGISIGPDSNGGGYREVIVNLGGIDLVDWVSYAWILDGISGVDGLGGTSVVRGVHNAQPDYLGGNWIIQNVDLLLTGTDRANHGSWFNALDYDVQFRLDFSDGGVSNPTHSVLDQFGEFTAPNPVPEPATVLLMGIGLAGLGFARRRRLNA